MNKKSPRKVLPLRRGTVHVVQADQLDAAAGGMMNPTRSCEPDCSEPINCARGGAQ